MKQFDIALIWTVQLHAASQHFNQPLLSTYLDSYNSHRRFFFVHSSRTMLLIFNRPDFHLDTAHRPEIIIPTVPCDTLPFKAPPTFLTCVEHPVQISTAALVIPECSLQKYVSNIGQVFHEISMQLPIALFMYRLNDSMHKI